ncbi:hypothetical protein CEXT_240681 [Caerostris extrusa]|uniref:Uncharacterized protein n=1 Tax=Caerostris extrusa TaxID=172846 RepID=A0AAV4PA68_CAEEX|nr:hypothetical protein CEXT_240681 [Caerostris extrusa]
MHAEVLIFETSIFTAKGFKNEENGRQQSDDIFRIFFNTNYSSSSHTHGVLFLPIGAIDRKARHQARVIAGK